MRIIGIEILNLLGIQHVDVHVNKPILFVSGENGQGKSSLAEILEQVFTGVVIRSSDKKAELIKLVHRGQKSGNATITMAEGVATLALPSNKRSVKIGALTMGQMERIQMALPYTINADRFARADQNTRRTFLFNLMNVETSAKAVGKRLRDKGHADKRVDQVAPLVAASFDDAAEEAKVKARDGKAAWKVITGGQWGSDKGAEWVAEKPEFNPEDLIAAEAEVARLTDEYGELSSKAGGLIALAKKDEEQQAKRAELTADADKLTARRTKYSVDLAHHAEFQGKVHECRSQAEGAAHKTLACPHCAGIVEFKDDVLIECNPTDRLADLEAVARLPEMEKSLEMLSRSVANSKRDVEKSEAAVTALSMLDDVKAPTAEEVAEARRKVSEVAAAGRTAQAAATALKETKQAAQVAEEKTATALAQHEDIMAWLALADDLSPNGIPADLMKDALEPFNQRLRDSAEVSQWKPVQIQNDMSILVAGHTYHMESESHRWRSNGMIAESIAHFSGAKLIVLDRYDVLNKQGRIDLIEWLDYLATSGAIDTAIVMGTASAMPSSLPEAFQTEWIADGSMGVAADA